MENKNLESEKKDFYDALFMIITTKIVIFFTIYQKDLIESIIPFKIDIVLIIFGFILLILIIKMLLILECSPIFSYSIRLIFMFILYDNDIRVLFYI